MPTIINFVAPPELLFQPAEKEALFANRTRKPIRFGSIREPEQPLWKLSARAVSPKCPIVELFVLMLFLLVAVVATISCFAELSHLLESDALGHIAARIADGQ